jgi:menaquinone-dependent protoporphyrinogen oxidase
MTALLMKILIAFASIHGSTAEVAQFLGRVLRVYNAEVTVLSAGQVTTVDPYDAFVLGTAIEDGMWLHEMFEFLDRFQAKVAKKPNYLWLNCIRVIEPDGYEHALKYYVHEPTIAALAARDVAVFAGKLKLESINWDERWLLSLRYDGIERPAFLNRDFRNWELIAAWGNKIAHELNLTPTFEDEKIALKSS